LKSAKDEVLKSQKKGQVKLGQTKEEQEALLSKFQAMPSQEPQITASGIDFSKGFEDQKEQDDVKKEVMKFPTECESCG